MPLQPSCADTWLKLRPNSNELLILGQWLPLQSEKELHCPNGGPTWLEVRFLSPFVQRRRELAHRVLFAPFRHCWKWHHKLKVVWYAYVCVAYNRFTHHIFNSVKYCLQTSHKCSCSYPVQNRDSTHRLINDLQQPLLLAPVQTTKNLQFRK